MPDTSNVMDVLRARGFIKQVVFEEDLYELLGKESVPFYIGFDPTADSLHVGHFLALMAMGHMQRAGHKPVVLIGGGTGKIGDPSGRSDMRKVMTDETVRHNCECFKKQMSRFFSFEGENAAVMVNNADWLDNLNYLDFMREVGSCFSVNNMLRAECYKTRMEKGLTFLEFTYMLLQAYDFLYMYDKFGVRLECGGDDQWSNILAGADLIRRKLGKPAFAMTFTLLLTSDGRKMGKTQGGAVWLDAEKTSPYDFYQYFRNVDDNDVENCLKLLTFVDLDEIAALCAHKDERINEAKKRLAYETTLLVHGKEAADRAQAQAQAAFGGGGEMPAAEIDAETSLIVDVLFQVGAAKSKTEARKLIEGGGIRLDGEKVADVAAELTEAQKRDGFVLHKGKKLRLKVSVR